MSSARLQSINKELRRCMDELSNSRFNIIDNAELRALETEIFGRSKTRVIYPDAAILGAKGDTLTHGAHDYVHAYYIDNIPDETYLNSIESCLSGDLYKEGKVSDFRMFREIKSFKKNEKKYEAIIHKTNNKKNSKSVCSVSLFETGSRRFIAYLFTTNDPLAFDNFNCFRGNSMDSINLKSNPTMRCVEQDIFCELKVKIADKLAREMPAESLKQYVMNDSNRINYKIIAQVINDQNLTDEINDIEKKDKRNEKDCLAVARKYLDTFPADNFKEGYSRLINKSIGLDHNLSPFENYKSVGRKVIALPGFFDVFDSISMVCVLLTRMRRLQHSPHERALVASMIPQCVLECSDNDNLWAYQLKTNADVPVKLDWLVEDNDGKDKMFEYVEDALAYQSKFITEFNNTDEDTQLRMLFDSGNKHKLGLSEKLLQSLWTGEINLSNTLVQKIKNNLGQYNFNFEYYIPPLKKTERTSMETAAMIGEY